MSGAPEREPRRGGALTEAVSLAEEAAKVGFDWEDLGGVLEKVEEELAELRAALEARQGAGEAAVKHELGDLLQALANLGRFAGVSPEEALHAANARFAERFACMGTLAAQRGQRLEELDAPALDRLWREAKARLASPSLGAGRG